MALLHDLAPTTAPDSPQSEPRSDEPHVYDVPEPTHDILAPGSVDAGRGSGLLDLDPVLVRSMRNGILGGIVVAILLITVPLTITRGWAYGLGVGGQVAFWCGIGFGMIAGSAAYSAKTDH